VTTKFSIYADGSSGGNSTGPIGWGWVVVKDDSEVLCANSGGHPEGTNNIAELMGAREGLKALLQHEQYHAQVASGLLFRIELVSDSQYVLGLANGSYSATKNQALAEHVRDLCRANFVQTRWVKGHNGDPINEMCDKLAKMGKEQFGGKTKKRARKRYRKRKRR
jgi:ribonuclease HI